MRGGAERTRGRQRTAVLAAILALMTTAARADEVTSKGTVLKGKVTGFSSTELTVEPEYDKGSLVIDWKDVEDVKTDGPFQVLYGDDLEADAPMQGFTDGKVLVGGAAETATAIPTADIHSAVGIGPDGLTWKDELRSAWRYWDGSADVGLNLQQATTDTFGFLLGMHTTRVKAPTRFSIGGDYRYSTQKKQGSDTETIEDRAFGAIREEYDLTDKFYLFGAGDVTYDAIQKLSIRGIPKLGVCYNVWEEKLDETKRASSRSRPVRVGLRGLLCGTGTRRPTALSPSRSAPPPPTTSRTTSTPAGGSTTCPRSTTSRPTTSSATRSRSPRRSSIR
jgi:hypothetical protein